MEKAKSLKLQEGDLCFLISTREVVVFIEWCDDLIHLRSLSGGVSFYMSDVDIIPLRDEFLKELFT